MSKIKKLRTRCFFDVSIAEDNVGRIVFELFNDVCPKTCENFRALCTGERGLGKFTGKPLHYKDVAFHRIVKDFIIQSGDFSQGNGKGGESIYGGTFEDESFHFKHEKPFLLSMANRGKNTNGSQFFITLAPAPHLDGVHVVYGHVIAGQDTVLKIANQAVDKNSKPLVNVRISNCGELIPQIKSKDSKTKRTKEMSGSEDSDSDSDESSSNSDDSDDGSESSSSNEGEIVDDKTSSHKDKKSKDNKTDDNLELDKTAPESDEPKYFSTVKPEEVPEIPPNRFLMRSFENKDNDNNRDTEKSKNEGKQPAKFDRSYSKRILYTKSGRKIKGRGFVRFRTPSPDRGRSQRSETPPHWKLATQKLKTLKEAIEEQSHNSNQADLQYSGRNDNRRFNGRQQRYQRSRSRSPHYNNNRHDNRRRDYSPDSKRSDRISNQNHYQQRNRSRSTSVEVNRPMHQDNPEEQKNKVIEEGEIDESIDNSRLSKANSLIESKREFNRKRAHSPNRDKPYRERSRSASVDKNRTKELKQSAQLNKGDTSIVAGSKDRPAQKHHDRKLSKLETRFPESRKSRSRSPIRKKHDRNRSRSLSIDSSRAKKQKDNAEDSRIKETTQTNIVGNNNDSRLENRKLSRRDQSPLESVNRTRSPTNNRFQSRRYRSRSASFDNLSKDIANKTTTLASSAKTDNKKVVKDTDKDSKRTEIKKDLRRSPDYSKLSSDRKRSPSPDRSKQQRKRSRSSSFVVDRNKDHSRKDDKNIKKDKKDEFRKEENRRDDRRDGKLHPQYPESKRNDRNRSSRSPYDDNRKKSHRNRSRSSSVGNNKRAHESKDNNNEKNKKLDNGKHNRKSSLDRAENGHSSKKSISEVTTSGSSSHRHGHSSHHKESHHQERTHRQSKHTRHSSPRNISPSR